MPAIRLTQRRVNALRPRRKVCDLRDTELRGYGVRVMPSGTKRYFIHTQHQGRRVWKTVSDATAMTEAEARALAGPRWPHFTAAGRPMRKRRRKPCSRL